MTIQSPSSDVHATKPFTMRSRTYCLVQNHFASDLRPMHIPTNRGKADSSVCRTFFQWQIEFVFSTIMMRMVLIIIITTTTIIIIIIIQSLDCGVVGETWSTHRMTASARQVCPLLISSGLGGPIWSILLGLSAQHLTCLPRFRPPSRVPCSTVLARLFWREMWPSHASFLLFTIPNRFSCCPARTFIPLCTNSFVLRSFHEIPNMRL